MARLLGFALRDESLRLSDESRWYTEHTALLISTLKWALLERLYAAGRSAKMYPFSVDSSLLARFNARGWQTHREPLGRIDDVCAVRCP